MDIFIQKGTSFAVNVTGSFGGYESISGVLKPYYGYPSSGSLYVNLDIVNNNSSINISLTPDKTSLLPEIIGVYNIDGYGLGVTTRILEGRANIRPTVIDYISQNTGFSGVAQNSITQISIQSNILDFKEVQSINIYTVPSGYVFLFDEREILTTNISSPATPPSVSFGNELDSTAYENTFQTTSNSLNSRHIIENKEDAISANTTIVFNVVTGSTASIHEGAAIIKGSLVKL